MTRTRKSLKTILTGLAFAAMTLTSLAAPASAAGSISLTILPGTAQDAQAMRAGMQIFSLLNAMESGASVSQNGMNNLAGIGQNGTGNNGIIYQEGNGHSANLQQTGNNNSYGIFQFGEDTNVDVSQYGNDQTGATFIFGF
jgi:Curlin associated repeat